MRDDDATTGHIFTRRELLVLLGAGGAAMLTGYGSQLRAGNDHRDPIQCVARPQQTEGPFFVDERLNRSDIRPEPGSGSVPAGVPLTLAFVVSRLNGSSCAPLSNAYVDVWQCDAFGAYSDVAGSPTAGRKFLRGYQTTGADGRAAFTTIYPGWYQGRTVHIHFKIRTELARTGYEFTSQLYFPDALTDTVHAHQPYAQRSGRRVRNERDGIFRNGGDQLLLDPTPEGAGYSATFHVALHI